MRKYYKLIFVVAAFSVFISGCATMPTPEQAANADYGSYPSNYESIVKNYYNSILKDPGSANFQHISSPEKRWYGGNFMPAKYGYLVCASVNAKNSYGGYVGYSTDGLFIRNGYVIDYFQNGMKLGTKLFCN